MERCRKNDDIAYGAVIEHLAQVAREGGRLARHPVCGLSDRGGGVVGMSERTQITIGETTFPAIEYVGPDEEEPGALESGNIFFTFDTDELVETNDVGVYSLIVDSGDPDEIQTPDGTFTGRVVQVGVGGGGSVGMYIETDLAD